MMHYNTKGLPEHDRKPIQQAQAARMDYGLVHQLMKEAETERGHEILHLIATDYYHADECGCGLI